MRDKNYPIFNLNRDGVSECFDSKLDLVCIFPTKLKLLVITYSHLKLYSSLKTYKYIITKSFVYRVFLNHRKFIDNIFFFIDI